VQPGARTFRDLGRIALALGTLLHAVFWLTLTGLGLAVARSRRTSLGELDEAAGG
jgi:hypothetical protein